jgi:hypothetical protein
MTDEDVLVDGICMKVASWASYSSAKADSYRKLHRRLNAAELAEIRALIDDLEEFSRELEELLAVE